MNNVFADGGKGAEELAKLVVETIEKTPSEPLKFIYENEDSVRTKIDKVGKQIYGAKDIAYSIVALKKIKQIEALGISHYPICIAKTQYSFSDAPEKLGAPEGFTVTVRNLKISAGAGFVVALTGDIMTMPGLPKVPAAEKIDVDNAGVITGLF